LTKKLKIVGTKRVMGGAEKILWGLKNFGRLESPTITPMKIGHKIINKQGYGLAERDMEKR